MTHLKPSTQIRAAAMPRAAVTLRAARPRAGLLGLVLLTGIVVLAAGCGGRGMRSLRRGAAELEDGHPDRAIPLLEEAVVRLPDQLAPRLLLAEAHRTAGDLSAAVAVYHNAIERDADSIEAWRGLSIALADSGDAPAAAEAWGRVVSIDPADTSALLEMGRARLAADDLNGAAGALHAVIERGHGPEAAAAALTLAEMAEARGDHGEAARRLRDAAAYDPSLAIAQLRLARLNERRLGNPAAARAGYRAYLAAVSDPGLRAVAEQALARLGDPSAETDPGTSGRPPTGDPGGEAADAPGPTTTRLPELTVEQRMIRQADTALRTGRNDEAARLFADLAVRYRARGRTDAALSAARRAADLAGDDNAAHLRLVADIEDRPGHADAALRAWKTYLESSPNDLAALARAAQLAVDTGETDAALLYARRAARLRPDDPATALRVAAVYDHGLEMPDEAAAVYVEFLARFPNHPGAEQVRTRVRQIITPETAGQPWDWPSMGGDGAAAATAADGAGALARFHAGYAAQSSGNIDEAISDYLAATNLDPGLSRAYFNLAICYRERSDELLAAAAYFAALAAEPDHLNARYNLALLLDEQGDTAGAIAQWERLLADHPDEPSAHLALGGIYARSPATVDRARAHYARYVQLDPGNPVARDLREWLRSTDPARSRRTP